MEQIEIVAPPHAGTARELQLDVVRGIAVLLAVGYHMNVWTGNAVVDALQLPGRKFGWAGVDLFFVLSGFLVGRIILNEIRDHDGFHYGRFLVRRALRLWPVLYAYLFAKLLLDNDPWQTFLPQNLFHVQN